MIIDELKNKEKFTSVENNIIDFILENANIVINLSLEEFSKASFASQASIIRLCKKLGNKGYSDFKIQLAKELTEFSSYDLNMSVDIPIKKDASISEIKDSFFNLSEKAIKNTKNNLNELDISKAAHMISNADIVHIYGRGESLILAEDFQYKLMRIGKHVHLDPLNGFNENQNYLKSKMKECAIVISQYCNSTQIHYILDELKNSNIPIILLTAADDIWPYDTYATLLFKIQCDETRIKMGCFSSRASFLYILDCIYGATFVLQYDKNKKFLIDCAKQKEKHDYYYRNLKK